MQPGDILAEIEAIVREYRKDLHHRKGNWVQVTPGDICMDKIAAVMSERLLHD